MSIPSTFIDELLTRTDIVALINRYIPTPLKKSGRSYMACCPFHDEKTPSFSVSRDKGLYYCFGCHASGGAIKFLMDHQRMTFQEAVEELARLAGMEVPRLNTRVSTEAQKRFDKMHTIMNKVSEFYRTQLKQNTQASDYLTTRQLAKRQLTWLRNQASIVWVNVENLNPERVICEYLRSLNVDADIEKT